MYLGTFYSICYLSDTDGILTVSRRLSNMRSFSTLPINFLKFGPSEGPRFAANPKIWPLTVLHFLPFTMRTNFRMSSKSRGLPSLGSFRGSTPNEICDFLGSVSFVELLLFFRGTGFMNFVTSYVFFRMTGFMDPPVC